MKFNHDRSPAHTLRRAAAAAVLGSVAAGLSACSSDHSHDVPFPSVTVHGDDATPQQKRAGASAIVSGFRCKIAQATDMKTPPHVRLSPADTGSRTTLALDVAVTISNAAVHAQETFVAFDSGVDWQRPALMAYTDGKGTKSINPRLSGFTPFADNPVVLGVSESVMMQGGDQKVTFYPRNTYHEGTTAGIFLNTEASTVIQSGGNTKYTAREACGTLIFHGGSWQSIADPNIMAVSTMDGTAN